MLLMASLWNANEWAEYVYQNHAEGIKKYLI